MEQIKKALKDSAGIRWGILFLIAFVQAANYYFYDAISPLKRLLEDNFNFTSSEYGLFVAAYSIPNTFLLMAVLGGIILDRIGIRRTGFMFVGMMAIGGLITAYGASEYYTNGGFGYALFGSFLKDFSPEIKMMLLGRFLFGLGAETSIVVVSKVIVKWFKGKELALAFGMKIGIARAGSAMAIFYSAELAQLTSSWTIAIWFAAILLLVAFLAFLIYTVFDVRLDRQLKEKLQYQSADRFSFADLMKLLTNKSFIYVTMLCVTFYSAVFPFQAYSPDFLLNKFGMSLTQSGKIASILYWVTMGATPFFGFLVDRFGRSATFMIFGSILLTLIHTSFAFTSINPIVPLVLLGMAIALVPAAMWPSVAKIVAEKRIGTAYGAMFSIQNLGLFAFPILAGVILDASNKNAETYLLPNEVENIKINRTLTADYLDNNNAPLRNKSLLASISLFEIPDTLKPDENKSKLRKQIDQQGKLIWTEYYQTISDDNGKFTFHLGNDSTDRFNINYLDVTPERNLIHLSLADLPEESILMTSKFMIDPGIDHIKFQPQLNSDQINLLDGDNRIMITVYDTSVNTIIFKEEHDATIDKNGQLDIRIGKGQVKYLNVDYLKWPDNLIIKIRKPLNYTNAILMFAILGIFGFIFALLLKREDKKSGYGLELPSNIKAKNSN